MKELIKLKEFTYERLVEYRHGCLLKAEKTALLREWKPANLPKALSKLKAPEINKLFLEALTEERAKKLYLENTERFGFTDWDVQDFFDINLTGNQMVRLAKKGKLKVVGRYCSPVSGLEKDKYDPVDFLGLTDDDFAISDDPVLVNQTTLLQWGWTKSLIDKLLPPPQLSCNPRYKCAAPMKQWDSDEVRRLMGTPEFLDAQKGRAARRAGAQKAVETKRDKLMAQVAEKIKEIRVDASYSDAQLREDAIDDRQAWYDYIAAERGMWNDSYAGDADESTIRRWVVNFIRHSLTDYDEDLYGMAGKVGCHEGYVLYRNAVLDKIAETYPQYKDECRRQKAA